MSSFPSLSLPFSFYFFPFLFPPSVPIISFFPSFSFSLSSFFSPPFPFIFSPPFLFPFLLFFFPSLSLPFFLSSFSFLFPLFFYPSFLGNCSIFRRFDIPKVSYLGLIGLVGLGLGYLRNIEPSEYRLIIVFSITLCVFLFAPCSSPFKCKLH